MMSARGQKLTSVRVGSAAPKKEAVDSRSSNRNTPSPTLPRKRGRERDCGYAS